MYIKKITLSIFVLSFFALSFALPTLIVDSPVFAQCGDVETSVISCPDETRGIEGGNIWFILEMIIGILTALAGVAALAGIVYGAVLYTSAGGNAEQTKKAMGIITNVVIGVIAFALMFAFLNFLIPGGVFD